MIPWDPGLNNVVVLLGFWLLATLVILGLIVKLKFSPILSKKKSDQIASLDRFCRKMCNVKRYIQTYRHTDIQTYRQTETKKRVGIIRM